MNSKICPICREAFDESTALPKLFPCTGRHVFCLKCLTKLAEHTADHKLCLLRQQQCNPAIGHWTCAMCCQTVHIPKAGVDSLPTVKSVEPNVSYDDFNCPTGHKVLDRKQQRLIVFPCTRGHLVCRECLNAAPKSDHFLCQSFINSCDSSLTHIACPTCSEVSHLPRRGAYEFSSPLIFRDCLIQFRHDILLKKQELDIEFQNLSRVMHVPNCSTANEDRKLQTVTPNTWQWCKSNIQSGITYPWRCVHAYFKQDSELISKTHLEETNKIVCDHNKLKIDIEDLLLLYEYSSMITEKLEDFAAYWTEDRSQLDHLMVDILIDRMKDGVSTSGNRHPITFNLSHHNPLTDAVTRDQDLTERLEQLKKDQNCYLDQLEKRIKQVDRYIQRFVDF